MLTFFVVVIVFSILIIVHELGHMLMARRVGVKVERFSLGFGKKLFSVKKGETEYVLSAFPLGGYVKLAGEEPGEASGGPGEFYSKSLFERFLVLVGGPLTNFLFAFFLFIFIFMLGMPSLTTRVGNILSGYPAKAAGIKEGDRIFEIEGKKVEFWHELVEIVQNDKDARPLNFGVIRGKRMLNFKIAPKVIKTKNIFGQEAAIGMIGVSPTQEVVTVRHNIFEAIALAAERLVMLTGFVYKGLWMLITGGIPFRESVAGPVGIALLIGQAAKLGFIHLLGLMAHINIALAVFNLLPFPILDGGHILFLGIEKLRKKPVSAKIQEVVAQVAFYILIAFALFVTWNDVARLPFFNKCAEKQEQSISAE